MKKIFLITMFITMLFMTTACDAVISLAEKSLYDVILDDLYTFYGADTEVTWTGFSMQPEGKMSEEYFEEVRESGDLFAAAEKSFRNAIDGVKVLHMNKTDTPFNENDRWVGAVGLMQHGKTLDVSVVVYELNEEQVYIKYHTDIGDKNVVYDLIK